MIKKFSLKKDGELYITPHFQVKEFACKDGSDDIYIDLDLAELEEKIRCYFNAPTYNLSAYRTEAYNKKVSNSKESQHCLGKAADIRVAGVSPIAVSLYAEFVLLVDTGGIGLYKGQNFVHVDTREKKARWVQPGNSSTYRVVSNIAMNL